MPVHEESIPGAEICRLSLLTRQTGIKADRELHEQPRKPATATLEKSAAQASSGRAEGDVPGRSVRKNRLQTEP